MPLLSIIIPAYNEAATVAQVIGRVEAAELPDGFSREIIIINDGSTDQTAEALKPFEGRHTVLHTENSGKGGACTCRSIVSTSNSLSARFPRT